MIASDSLKQDSSVLPIELMGDEDSLKQGSSICHVELTPSTCNTLKQQSFNEFLGIDSNTYATLTVTICVFVLGLLFQRFFNLTSKFIERRKTRKAFRVALREFVKETNKQSEKYLEDSEKYRMDKRGSFEFTRVSLFTYSSIRELGFEKTYAAFFLGIENWIQPNSSLRHKAFMRVWSSAHSVEFWSNQAFSDMSKFLDGYNKISDSPIRYHSVNRLRF